TPFGGSPEFTTWNNICYDRAASIWLIQHFVDSNATFRFIEFGKKVDVGIPFDVPGAELGRQRNLSCFETVISTYDIPDPVLLKMAKLVHDIDVNIWGSKVYPFSDSLDKQFKQLRKVEPDDKHLLNVTAINFEKLYSQIKNGIIDVK
nr:chromate resistance protein [Bacteroidota bacterium]